MESVPQKGKRKKINSKNQALGENLGGAHSSMAGGGRDRKEDIEKAALGIDDQLGRR